ncbi:hypothetical protein [Brevundimonas sp.]
MRRPVAVRVVGPVQWIFIPAAIALAATVVLATPISLFGLHLPEPVIPMVLAFAWAMIRPSIVAPLMLLLIGLLLDAFWHTPLGLWPLALLSIYGVVLFSRSFLIGQERAVLFVTYAACCVMAYALCWLIMTMITGVLPNLLAVVGSLVPTLLLFPFANRMIERFEDGDVRFR